MHAVLAQQSGQSFSYASVPRPVPGPGEVLVGVRAAAITRDELTWPQKWPAVPSFEISGVVAEAGADAAGFAPGDQVYALLDFNGSGGAADYVPVPAARLAVKPTSVDHVAAASLPLAALTAWQALTDHAHLKTGQRVLVHGGAGGVGNYGVQLAAALGAEVVATASSNDADYVRSLGASLVLDYRTAWEAHVEPVDVVLDTVGGPVLDRSWQVIRGGGILVAVATPPPDGAAEAHGVRGDYFIVTPDQAQLTELARLVDAGTLRPQVGLTFPFSEAAAAFEALTSAHPRGKVVLTNG
ncbi:NADP-dependent oxidoreductase [Actinomadura rupiterrae]|uniref:NADP-dependent oxidoreductase n=1 Tax=Actinomadura rupiterrae TaxID=559627 RepID=UPI0020A37FF0|nr:NADP-dependent oxidoreductase [Actinomadura rupiterrae]MCP2339273.1 NADPH:quinone reductase-like Zn-dependent oxidoreductase [Actinomadura rupiterrae]